MGNAKGLRVIGHESELLADYPCLLDPKKIVTHTPPLISDQNLQGGERRVQGEFKWGSEGVEVEREREKLYRQRGLMVGPESQR